MRHPFPLFQSHLDFAHHYWSAVVKPGDQVIDATCGNGHDALMLCKLLLRQDIKSTLFLIDKQPLALEVSWERLQQHFDDELLECVHLLNQCHSSFPSRIAVSSVKLIVYNLGYLPGGDKQVTTTFSTTLESLKAALPLITKGGLLSVTCYPGHAEGKVEEQGVLDFASSLDPKQWSCASQRWINRKNSPCLLLIQKSF